MKLLGIQKRYGETFELSLPELELKEGSVTAVLGESGAGKTTLLNIIAGMIPFEGKVEGAGRVSYLYQSDKLLPHLTAEKNLKLVLEKSQWKDIPVMLERVGLKDKLHSYPHELSGGERQRVAIARAFLFPHDTLLMDEPFSSLDLSLKRSLLSLTRELWKETKPTTVFVTHDVHEAAMLADIAFVLKKGKIVGDVPIEGERDFLHPHRAEETLVRLLLQEEG